MLSIVTLYAFCSISSIMVLVIICFQSRIYSNEHMQENVGTGTVHILKGNKVNDGTQWPIKHINY